MNLLNETIEVLENNNRRFEDIHWIGVNSGYLSIGNFIKLANVEYNNGFGGNEVLMDLFIVGKDFYMYRSEYDGSEWWSFLPFEKFKKPVNEAIIDSLVGYSEVVEEMEV